MRRENVGIDILSAAVRSAAFFICLFIYSASHCQNADTTRVLTPFQRQSLIDYCEQYGSILSASELGNIDGFTPDEAQWLWDNIKGEMEQRSGTGKHTATAKFKKKYLSEGFSTTAKYTYEGNRFSSGIVIDNDPMERFPGFAGGYLKYKNFIAGDFSARFGQGLVLWKAFSLNAYGEPATLLHRQSGFAGYRSSDEKNYLRGVCTKIPIGRRLECNGFASFRKVDLNAVDSSDVHEFVAGVNAGLSSENWRIGLTAVTYLYDRDIRRRVGEYNRLRLYDGLWGNASIDFICSANHWRFFGEAALDAKASPAALAGVLWTPSYNLEAGFTAKAFSPAYSATHAMEDSYNLIGGQLSVMYRKGAWKFNLNAEYGWHPWYSYGKPAGETVFKARVAAQYTSHRGTSFIVQSSWNKVLKLRLHVSIPAGPFKISSRLEGNLKGYAVYAETAWRSDKLEIAARGTFYNTDGWDSRVYLYEKNVPESFSSEVFHGKGLGAYLIVKYAPIRSLNLWLKVRHDYSVFFIRMVIPG